MRRDIVRMVHAVNSGHPGGSLGCVEFFVALYGHILKHTPKAFTMDGMGEDLFFLSNGHISPVFYSVLARYGYFEVHELNSFRNLVKHNKKDEVLLNRIAELKKERQTFIEYINTNINHKFKINSEIKIEIF